MAITAPHYRLLKELQPQLPQGGTLLEIGEANWYGDVDPREFGYEPVGKPDLFAVARAFYESVFAPSSIVSVDMGGTPSALRMNLNAALPLVEKFDVVINHGTAEHIFNIAQVFLTMHERCARGGLMIHDAPFTGWVDHGFYCLQPTLFYDLAAANGYQIVKVAVTGFAPEQIYPIERREQVAELAKAGSIPATSMLFVVYRKIADGMFQIPQQGYYSRSLSEAGNKAWRELR